MGERASKIFADAMKLPTDERAELLRDLIESVDGPADPRAAQEWTAEIETRARAAIDGTAASIPWETVKSELDARLKR